MLARADIGRKCQYEQMCREKCIYGYVSKGFIVALCVSACVCDCYCAAMVLVQVLVNSGERVPEASELCSCVCAFKCYVL